MSAWPLYDVTVDGYGTAVMTGASRGKVIAETWRSDVFSHLSFGAFLKICRVARRSEPLVDDGYGYIRDRYRFDAKVGQVVELRDGRGDWGRTGVVIYPNSISTAHVHVAVDGSEHASCFHPSDVRSPPSASPALPQEGVRTSPSVSGALNMER